VKKHVYRVGDIVEIGEGVFPVRRVGYPLHFSEVTEEMMAEEPRLAELLAATNKLFESTYGTLKSLRDIKDNLQKAYVELKGFGGRDRALRYADSAVKPGVYKVTQKKVVKTGKYHPASAGGGNYYLAEVDPAYLEDEQTHILLSLIGQDKLWSEEEFPVEASKVKPVTEEVSK